MSTMTREIADLRAVLVATQQQLALMMHGQANAPPIVAWPTVVLVIPPPVAYAIPPPTYVPQPPHMYGPIPAYVHVGRQGGARSGR